MKRQQFPLFRLLHCLLILGYMHVIEAQSGNRQAMPQAEISIGDTVPSELVIHRPDGTKTTLLEIINGKHTVLVTGCLTCPIFHRTYPTTEAIYADYRDREDIQFFYIYKSLAHPELNGYVQPVTLDEKLQHIVEAKRVLGTTIPWLCDGMDNSVRRAFGLGPNSDLIISPEGKLLHAVRWTDGDLLREKIVSLVGDSDTHTSVSDLELDTSQAYLRQRSYDAGVLPKPKFSSQMNPVKISPIADGQELYYVKPRVEVDRNVLRTGSGEMYLGFFPDPIHGVHWNNLVDPVRYELVLPPGTRISPSAATAPQVDQDSDADPREFKLQVESLGRNKQIELNLFYFACSKEEGWCKPVTQKYMIHFERDPDGGGTMGRSFRFVGNTTRNQQRARPGARNRGQSMQQPGRRVNAAEIKRRIMGSDRNGDGRILPEELPQQMRQRFRQMDGNGDGHITEKEVDQMLLQRFGGGNSRLNSDGV